MIINWYILTFETTSKMAEKTDFEEALASHRKEIAENPWDTWNNNCVRDMIKNLVKENREGASKNRDGTAKDRLDLTKILWSLAIEDDDAEEIAFLKGKMSVLKDLISAEQKILDLEQNLDVFRLDHQNCF